MDCKLGDEYWFGLDYRVLTVICGLWTLLCALL